MVGSISGSSYQSSMLSQLTQKLFSMMDEDGSGSSSQTETSGVSGQESSLIDALFSNADSDGSDAITQQEFASMLSQLFQEIKGASSEGMSNAGAPPPPPDSSGMISSLDTDGDGSLSVDEMTAGGIRDAEKLFSEIDTDGDGLASEDELNAFAETMAANGPQGMNGAPPPPPDSGGMISSLDTDGDGSLSVDEMTAGGIRDAEKLFGEIDTDGDGLASEDELNAFDEKMKANGPQVASSDSESNSTIALQTEFLDKLIEMISQYKGYTDSTANSTSIFA